MFRNRELEEKVAALEEDTQALKEKIAGLAGRVDQLEGDCKSIRVGSVGYVYSNYRITRDSFDTRPTVSMHEVATRLMAHLGLEFEHVPGTDARIILKKREPNQRIKVVSSKKARKK